MASILCPACRTPNPEFNSRCSSCSTPLPLSLGPVRTEGGSDLHSSEQDDPLTVRSLAHYRVLRPIGAGGMGRVYAAEDTKLGRIVALKVLPPAREVNPGHLERFRREIHALQRLRHPGVVQILDSGTTEGLPWYAMELIEGPSLRQCVQAPGGASLEMVLTLVRRLCGALAYVHGEGVVHRDLKPDNVLVRAASGDRQTDGRLVAAWPVLVDFGVMAEFKGTHSRESLSADARAAGTPLYMAPEQLRGELLDARADLYALGCVLYELLRGRPPFTGNAAQVREAHLHDEPEPLREQAPWVPEPLEALVLRLLAKEPRRRLGYATDVAAALEKLGARDGQGGPEPRAYLYRPGFVGRQQALSELDAHLGRLEAGQGGVVLIRGESGGGKTRLLLELGRRALGRQVRVLSGECLAEGGALEALRKPLQALGRWGSLQGRGATLRLLGRYEPSLLELEGVKDAPEPAELPADAARLRLFDALARSFGAWAAEQPLLLELDDLQWADELTLEFLQFFLRAKGTQGQHSAPLLVAGAYRSEEVGIGHADGGARRGALLLRLIDTSEVVCLNLERMEAAALGAMVRDMLALEQPAEKFERFLERQTEGNPLFAGEYLRTAVAEGVLYRDEQGHWQVAEKSEGPATEAMFEALPLPGALRELLARRLNGLGAEARRLLEAACVLGREADEALLGRMLGGSAKRRLEAARELLARQLMEEGGPGLLRFAHDKLREVAYEGLPLRRRKALHRKAAEQIVARFGSGSAEHQAMLGHHWERAGVVSSARECYLAAARKSVSQDALRDGARLYRSYLALVETPTAKSVEARNDLGRNALHPLGDSLECVAEHERALQEARQIRARALEAESLRLLGLAHLPAGKFEQGHALIQQALAIVRERGDLRSEGLCLANLAEICRRQGRLDEAHTLCDSALAIHARSATASARPTPRTDWPSRPICWAAWSPPAHCKHRPWRFFASSGIGEARRPLWDRSSSESIPKPGQSAAKRLWRSSATRATGASRRPSCKTWPTRAASKAVWTRPAHSTSRR